MNNNLLFPSLLSICIHVILFVVPFNFDSFFTKNIDTDVIRAPASIEISMVRSTSPIKIEAQKIKTMSPEKQLKSKEDKKDGEEQQKQIIEAKPTIGAITEQISSLMVNRPPAYPTLARIKGWEGEVTLIALVNENGNVIKVSVLSGSGFYILDSAAIKAVSKWRFRNINKAIEVKIPVKFVLR